jgi:hypothetical protein
VDAAGAAAGAAGRAAGLVGRAALAFASDSRALCPRIFPIREPRIFIVVPLRDWRSEITPVAAPSPARADPFDAAVRGDDSASECGPTSKERTRFIAPV